ncbi:uncharacterized protein MYCGRDRAFT_104723 [Zymoseptoria tritici IPO323]|uniref:Uncharacterized protein n=1 Tax=Zymoseptoria tritici (strain CBS 115943 / IPO323) TaxID=336722 RepID=F9XED2_ZYMTI|nr:uncharacterized protein MYCGRDRAFT_104723 [Zymoseptoria tritici IPO323]EGP86322.1 hypothetical protein MYCGRDRAFT_104723 [Zymoseptoria tritici IPO323]
MLRRGGLSSHGSAPLQQYFGGLGRITRSVQMCSKGSRDTSATHCIVMLEHPGSRQHCDYPH